MTPAAIIAGLRRMEEEIARLRAHVATLTAAPATTTEPGLDLDARVPCALCGGEFVWTTFDRDDDRPAVHSARCRCGAVWEDMLAPVTWRTIASAADEVPAAYVARLVAEVDRLRALLTDSTPSPAQSTAQDAHRCPRCGAGSPEVCGGAREWWLECGRCGHTSRDYPTEEDAVAGGFRRSSASTPSPAPADNSGADPARGEGVSARACWDCAHDSEGNGRGMCLRQRGATFSGEVSAWIAGNYDREPKPWARNCPGWAPKSGEVSDGS